MYLVNSYRHKSTGEEEGTDAHVEGKKTREDEEEEEKKGGIARDPKEGVKGPAADMFDVSRLHALYVQVHFFMYMCCGKDRTHVLL